MSAELNEVYFWRYGKYLDYAQHMFNMDIYLLRGDPNVICSPYIRVPARCSCIGVRADAVRFLITTEIHDF